MNAVRTWAHDLIEQQAGDAARALRRFCKKPGSAKRLHRARKSLARLRAALEDLGGAAAVESKLYRRVCKMHGRAGKVRDADVLIERTRSYRDRASRAERRQLKAVEKDLRKRRVRARRKLKKMLAKFRKLRA